ncbi:MAG: YlmC/YmxH family sporulation protein [Lachnospiraceae bacterium]|nr:YlmC/YmxH family sporulation protein [Lachnospiraceae bacterium]
MKESVPLSPFPIRFSDLRQKEIINICTCRTLGCVSDLEINTASGEILSLIVPGPGKLCWFLGRDYEYIIPWHCIIQIGTDIILVEVKEDDIRRKCEDL